MVKYSSHSPTEPHKAESIDEGYFIRIDEGPFEGVEFSFQDLKPLSEDGEGNFHMEYGYNIWYSPQTNSELTVGDFRKVIEEILHSIVLEVAEQIDVDSPEDVLESPSDGPEFSPHEIIGE